MPPPADLDATRAKLIEAAGAVFAEQGYQNATVRDICQLAGANVAAVNYHFGDKLGLYTQVLLQAVNAESQDELFTRFAAINTPEEGLRMVVHLMLEKMCSKDRPAWQIRIMGHEMANPSPALPKVFESIVLPRYNRLRDLIGAFLNLPPDHDTTRLCAHSIIGQVVHHVHARGVIAQMWPQLEYTPQRIEQIANHIADFSIAGVRALAQNTTEPRSSE